MNCRLRSRLDLLYPDVSRKVETQQNKQKQAHDNARPMQSFTEGDSMYAEDFTASACKWNPGTVVEATGPLSYTVRLHSGAIVRRHVDNLRRRDSSPEQEEITSDDSFEPFDTPGGEDLDLPMLIPAPVAPAGSTSHVVPVEGTPPSSREEGDATAEVLPSTDITGLSPAVPPTVTPTPRSETQPLPPTLRRSARSRPRPDAYGSFVYT